MRKNRDRQCCPALIVRRRIKAPRKLVFKAFTRADLLAEWFTPDPAVKLDILRFEFVENGAFSFRYIMPDGRQPVVGGVLSAHRRTVRNCLLMDFGKPPDPLEGVGDACFVSIHRR